MYKIKNVLNLFILVLKIILEKTDITFCNHKINNKSNLLSTKKTYAIPVHLKLSIIVLFVICVLVNPP